MTGTTDPAHLTDDATRAVVPPTPHRPAVYGHRGARGEVSENTIEGFARAAADGAEGVELDVLLTADGRAVVWHDPILDAAKVTPADSPLVGRRVRECTLADLRALDIGSMPQPLFAEQELVPGARMHTLAEVLTALRGSGMRVIVELKTDPTRADGPADRELLVDAALADIDAAGARGDVVMHSFDWGVLPVVARQAPDLPRSALAMPGDTFRAGSPWLVPDVFEDTGGDLVAAVAAIGAHVVCPFHGAARRRAALAEGMPGSAGTRDADPGDITDAITVPGMGGDPLPVRLDEIRDVVDADFVARAHAAGLSVVPWTVDDPDDLRDLARWGTDGVVVDHPARALHILDALAALSR